MQTTILIPHWRTGRMTAYTISQIIKNSIKHDIDIIVIDNNAGDGSTEYLNPFKHDITILNYPKDKLQSHGIGINFALELGFVKTKHFITLESDAYPENDKWLDYYENLQEYDLAGSLLKLSGGQYFHPCAAMYSKKLWVEAKEYCDSIDYAYFPNMSMKEGFQCHLMVHNSIFDEFIKNPDDYIELADGYKPYTSLKAIEKLENYEPVCCPFHHGVGANQESIKTYGDRTVFIEQDHVILDNRQKIVNRIGEEPGQWLSAFAMATGKKIFEIPTEVKWLPDRENQQQEYTLNEAGVKHCWGVSAYHDFTPENEKDIALAKQSIPDRLYDTLPKHQKIN